MAYYLNKIDAWFKVWSIGGLLLNHSLNLGGDWIKIKFRFIIDLSHKIKINKIILIIDK